MDLGDRAVHHAFFIDALSLRHYPADHPQRDKESEMDGAFLCHSNRHGNYNLPDCGEYGTAARLLIDQSKQRADFKSQPAVLLSPFCAAILCIICPKKEP